MFSNCGPGFCRRCKMSLYYPMEPLNRISSFEHSPMKIQFKQQILAQRHLSINSCVQGRSKCWYVLQPHVYAKLHFQHLVVRWPNIYVNKEIWVKQSKHVPLTKCYHSVKILDVIFIRYFDKYHFYSNESSRDFFFFFFIYMGVQDIDPDIERDSRSKKFWKSLIKTSRVFFSVKSSENLGDKLINVY